MATAGENIEDEVKDPIHFREQVPQPYIFEPPAKQRDPTDQQRQLLSGDRQETELWTIQNLWRIGNTA